LLCLSNNDYSQSVAVKHGEIKNKWHPLDNHNAESLAT